MNKRLLQTIVLFLCVLGSYAYNVGDYVFTTDGRFKVTGNDILKNGSITNQDVSSADFGWTDAGGAVLSTERWSIETGKGPNGEPVLESLSGADGVSLFQSIPFEATKSYIITFKIKGPEATTSTVNEGDANYIDVYANIDGTASKTAERFQQVASATVIGSDWTEVSFAFTDTVAGGKAGFINISLARLEAATQVTSFEVREVQRVFDTRIGQRALKYANMLLGREEFSKERDVFENVVTVFTGMLEDPSLADDEAEMNSLLLSLNEEQTAFLDANSADVMTAITSGNISEWSKFNNNENKKSYGDWVLAGTNRWGHGTKAEYANCTYPSAYDLDWCSAYIAKEGLRPGRYMFSVDAQAIKYTKSGSNSSAPNYAVTVDGTKVFVGTDSVDCGVLDPYIFNTYTAFGDLAEGDSLKAGIYFPGFGAGNGGGTFRLKNAVLRLVGVSTEELERAMYVSAIHVQQVELKNRLDIAKEDVASASYPWGKKDLNDSIDKCQPIYDESFTYVDADGNDLGLDIPEYYDELLLDNVRIMGSGINEYIAVNVPFTNLVDYTAEAQSVLDDTKNAGASESTKTALKQAISSSTSLINGVTSEPDSAAFASSLYELKTAVLNFKLTVACYDNPAELVLVNADFRNNEGAKSGKCEGWTPTLQSDEKGWWFFGNDDRFESGYKMYTSRGNTAFSRNKAIQKITITKAGLYEYRAQAYAVNTDRKKYNAMWNGMSGADSLRLSGIFFFFGKENAPDSVNVCTTQTTFTSSNWTADEVRTYSMFYNKKTDGEEVIELGMDALQNGVPMGAGCNQYAFGSNHVFFYGDSVKYATGIEEIPSVVAPATNSDSAVYTITGVKVGNSTANLPKGIYISRGKKFVIK